MITDFIQIEISRNKFYQKESEFKNFSKLTEENLVTLSKKVYRLQETMNDTLSNQSEKISKLERYQRTLQFLTSQNIRLELKTFDEKVAFLIMMIDPNLVTFKEFLKINLISLSDIEKVEDLEEKSNLKKKRNQTLSAYESVVREKIGFFDNKLITYEKMFFNKFFNEKELVTEVNNNNPDGLLFKSKLLDNFNKISDERFQELVSIAQTWLSIVPTKRNINLVAYSVSAQKNLLGLNNLAEQLVLFVLLIDSNLDILRIYEEESTMNNIKRRIIEEFGYFNKDLLTLEYKFYNRFCPNKEISIWSHTKNKSKQ